MKQNFPKSENLKSEKAIQALFSKGKSFTKYPIKLIYIISEEKEKTQAGFSAPKRNFKKAVDRNRIKRQLREAYRLQKHILEEKDGKKFAFMFLYLSKDLPQYVQLEKAMGKLLKQLTDENI